MNRFQHTETALESRIARKEHRCTSCGRRIPKGVRYWYSSNSDGLHSDTREHTNCEQAALDREPHLPENFNHDRKAKW